MAEKKADPDEYKLWLWKCNGCNTIRSPLVGYCQQCGSPEFSLIERASIAGQQLELFNK